MKRSSGIMMHIASLPEAYGIGTFGREAYRFADFLKASGQSYWQILPLGHTSYGDSPYQAFSAFAGNPYFIDFDFLVEEGFLNGEEISGMIVHEDDTKVNYECLFKQRYKLLRCAFRKSKDKLDEALQDFQEENAFWLKDYALYMSIKEKMNLTSWQQWDDAIKCRRPESMAYYEKVLAEEVRFWIFVQYMFYTQWNKLKKYVNSLGIEIIGDIPIYVASDSSDAWANAKLFKLDENKNPTVVAGCPPDAFSSTGQLWGNPIYDWSYLEETGYSWWIERIKESLKLYDVIRIDHFRGFEAYWEVPYGEETAINGRWTQGPGIKLFEAIKDALGEINIIAEDLGYLTQNVLDFRDATGYPGMKVLQFAFDPSGKSEYIPHTYHRHCVVYTGTHDNDTIKGWLEITGNKEEIIHAKKYLSLTEEEGYHWGFIRGAWSSVGNIAMTTMQDILGLGNEARMNMPSTLGGNWIWRMQKEDLTSELATRLYKITQLYGRCESE